ncbi:MAG: DUF2752 domain-containing protein [Planctomycetota bacterium]
MHPESVESAAAPVRRRVTSGYYRRRGAALLVPSLWALGIAASLEPARRGYGTHRQLDLPACAFRVRTGWPCPSCGLTTSVAAVTRGRLALAWRAQPFGIVLTAALTAMGVAGGVELIRGRPAVHRLRPGLWWLWCGLGGLFAGWEIVLVTGWADGTLPTH